MTEVEVVIFAACSGGEDLRRHFDARARRQGYELQLEAVIAGGGHCEWDFTVGGAVEVLGFQPCAKSGIVDFGLATPEVGLEVALDTKVPELQLDILCFFREIAAYILRSNVESSDAVTFALSFNDHGIPDERYRVRVNRLKKQPLRVKRSVGRDHPVSGKCVFRPNMKISCSLAG